MKKLLFSTFLFCAVPFLNMFLNEPVAMGNTPLPGEQPSYQITDHVLPEDCEIRRVGAKNINLCDLSAAFGRVETDIRARLDAVDFDWLGYGDHTGSVVNIPPGLWWLETPVRICRQMHISGASGGNGGATFLFVPKGGSGFHFSYFDECVEAGVGEGASGSLVENLNLYEATGTLTTSIASSAFWVEDTFVEIRNVQTYGFVQSIRISADHLRTPRTNANGWKVSNVSLVNPEHAGLFVDGGDANAGLASSVNLVGGCVRGSTWKNSLGPCASLVSSEQIGSTYLAIQASRSYDTTTGENFGNYFYDGDGQKSICVGCYSEADNVLPVLAPNVMAIGMHGLGFTGGFRQAGPVMSGLQITNQISATNKVTTNLGDKANYAGTGIEFKPAGGLMTQVLSLNADPANKRWRLDVGHLGSGVALGIGGTSDAQGGYGGVTVPKNLSLGAFPYTAMGTTTGTPAISLCNRAGNIYFEQSPTADGPVGYQCRTENSSWIWRSFR